MGMCGDDYVAAPAPPPEKTVKEMVDEAKKGINGILRETRREILRIEMDMKKCKKDQEKSVKKEEPKSTQKIYARNFLQKQNLANKYKGMEAKWEGVKVGLNSVSTTAQMVDTMQQMSTIMGRTGDMIDPQNIAKIVGDFSMATEKQNMMGEMIGDAMDDGEDVGDDCQADELIDSIGKNEKAKDGNKLGEAPGFDDDLANLKI